MAGIAWIVISAVILQFDSASVTTAGVLVGLMFMLSAAQNFAVASVADGATCWASALFGALFVAAGVICFIDPKGTFTALADILGFLFLLIGVWWMVRAFRKQSVNPLLVAGADLRGPDDRHGVLDGRPVALREGLHPPRVRRRLG